ncbi:Ribonucleotide reductase transcriptional regulator NrdR [Rhodococcus ruber]|nr:Ribonucleotide reductase transcriptional regulator NrdR [Rhodococcus ruber]
MGRQAPGSADDPGMQVLSTLVSDTTSCGRAESDSPAGGSGLGRTASVPRRRRGQHGYDEGIDMYCPYCRHPDSRVVDSREADEGAAIRRRRACPQCGRRFTTVETAVLSVVKRSGVTEPFSREKVVRGVARACQGRDVDNDALNLLAQQVEDAVRAKGSPEIPSNEVGLAILGPLRDLDEVAYLRFASVYRSFSSAEDFEREIKELREHQHRRETGSED